MLDTERRAGDRDLRSDDRQLFLDLILAAGDRLVLTYSGRAVSDNAPCASSVVIDELLDHLDRRSSGGGRTSVLLEHPLQPFSPRYFELGADARLFTFSTAQARTASASQQERGADLRFITTPIVPTERASAPTFELTIAELADCWCNASRYFCRHALGFTLATSDADAGDDELLMLDRMAQGGVRAHMLATALRRDRDPARELRQLQGSGTLPPRVLGEAWHAKLQQAVAAALSKVPLHVPERTQPISVSHADWRVSGALPGIRGNARYVVRAASFYPQHEVRAWVEHVIMCAAREVAATDVSQPVLIPDTTIVIEVEKGSGSSKGTFKGKVCETFTPVPQAHAVLSRIVQLAREGRTAPLAFFPAAAVAWFDARRSNEKFFAGTDKRIKSLKDPAALARAAFDFTPEHDRGMPGDDTDPHVALCFRGQDPMAERWSDFEALATILFAPRLPSGGGA